MTSQGTSSKTEATGVPNANISVHSNEELVDFYAKVVEYLPKLFIMPGRANSSVELRQLQ